MLNQTIEEIQKTGAETGRREKQQRTIQINEVFIPPAPKSERTSEPF
jgi:hypothetical protein